VAHLSCGDVPALPPDYRKEPAPDACKTAMEASCCTQATACAADADCMKLMSCRAACGGDYACRVQCLQQTPSNAAATAIWNCENGGYPDCVDLSCVGTTPPAPPTTSQHMRWRFLNFASQSTPITGAQVKVRNQDDLSCTSPLSTGTTDGDGWIDLDLPPGPGGTDAYLEVTGAAVAPTLIFIRSFDPELAPSIGVTMLDSGTLGALIGGLGAPSDPTRGTIAVNISSCGGGPVPGMKFASSNADSQTVQDYAVASLPSQTATMSDGKGTAGHFANHPAGKTTITVTDGTTGGHFGSLDVVVRGGFFTTVAVPPSP